MSRIKVLVVDDSVVVRRLVGDTLAGDPRLDVVGTAANGKVALAKIPQLNPDLLTLDVEMPVMDGLETLREVRRLYPRLPVDHVLDAHRARGGDDPRRPRARCQRLRLQAGERGQRDRVDGGGPLRAGAEDPGAVHAQPARRTTVGDDRVPPADRGAGRRRRRSPTAGRHPRDRRVDRWSRRTLRGAAGRFRRRCRSRSSWCSTCPRSSPSSSPSGSTGECAVQGQRGGAGGAARCRARC